MRNWLHADDTATAVMAIIDSGKTNEIYNIAGGFEQTNSDTVRKIIKAFYGTDDNWKQHIDMSYSREGQDVRYALDDSKLRAINWGPQHYFDEEISSIVRHYKEKFIW